jgi:hypothetical protein
MNFLAMGHYQVVESFSHTVTLLLQKRLSDGEVWRLPDNPGSCGPITETCR